MANEEVSVTISSNDQASKDLDNIKSKIDGLNTSGQETQKQMGGVSKTSGKAASGLSNIAKGAGIAAIAFMGFKAVGEVLSAVAQQIVELNEKLGEFEESVTKLDFMVNQMSGSNTEATETFELMTEQIEVMGERTGASVTDMNELMSELTLRLGSAEQASRNFERAMNIQAITGRGAGDVAKGLSEALAGQFGPLREAGILTVDQANALSEMEDKGLAASEAMRIVDATVTDYVDTTPLAVEASDRLSSSLDRVKVGMAQFLGVDRIMDKAARSMENLANVTETWTDGAFLGVRSITEEMEKLDQQVGNVQTSMQELRMPQEALDTQRLMQHVTREYDIQIERLGHLRDIHGETAIIQGRFVNFASEITKLEEDRADAVQLIQDGHTATRVELEAQNEFELEQLRLRRQALETEDEAASIRLETQFKINELGRVRDEQMNELIDEHGQITDEIQAGIIEEQFLVELLELQEAQEQKILGLKKDQNGVDQGNSALQEQIFATRAAALRTENKQLQALLDHRADILEIQEKGLEGEERRLALLQADIALRDQLEDIGSEEDNAVLQRTEDLIEGITENLEEYQKQAERGLQGSEPIMSLTASDVIAQDQARDLKVLTDQIQATEMAFLSLSNTFREGSDMMRGLGNEEVETNLELISSLEKQRDLRREIGTETESLDAHIDALRDENDQLRENHELMAQRFDDMSRMADSLSEVSFQVADLANQQWDFQEASMSVVQAQQALSGAVSAGLDAAGLGIKEKAKWMAAFETAQAAASLGLALAFPSPNYWAAVANHSIAATQFGLIAGGVIGGGSASASPSGQGGGSAGRASVNRDSIMEETMRSQDGNRDSRTGGTIIIQTDLGRGNTYLEESPALSRRLAENIAPELQELLDL